MNWKDRKKYPTTKDPLFSTRVPLRIQDSIRKLAADPANNTTINAIAVTALEDFVVANDPDYAKPTPPSSGGLFE